jgi:hypothetical protein
MVEVSLEAGSAVMEMTAFSPGCGGQDCLTSTLVGLSHICRYLLIYCGGEPGGRISCDGHGCLPRTLVLLIVSSLHKWSQNLDFHVHFLENR